MGFYKFEPDDVFHNVIKTYPSSSFFIYEGQRFYNNEAPISGTSLHDSAGDTPGAGPDYYNHVPAGYVSLHELNINRGEIEHQYTTTPQPKSTSGPGSDSGLYKNKSLIFPFTDPGNLQTFKRVWPRQNSSQGLKPPSSFERRNIQSIRLTKKIINDNKMLDKDGNTFAPPVTGSYPLSASITRVFYKNTNDGSSAQTEVYRTGSFVDSLKNTLSRYTHLSHHYEFSSSQLVKNTLGGGATRELNKTDVCLIDVPSIFYGSSIKKGSVRLKFFISGTLVGELHDERKNGELIQVSPIASQRSGGVAGVALYNEGILILTGAYDLSRKYTGVTRHVEDYNNDGSNEAAAWIWFASSISASNPIVGPATPSTPSSSYQLDFQGVNPIPTLTMFAHARKGMLNHSNNPTYIKYDQYRTGSITSGSGHYREPKNLLVKNMVSSSYSDPTGSFEKTTYISKIGIYDKNKNLIAIAKMATPVKKTTDRDLTFKLKMDL